MRTIAIDTETTGIGDDHRVIEIGAVEIVDRMITGREWHAYLNPIRDIDPAAERVHGISRAYLADKPKFFEVAHAFEEFVRGADLVAHNADFDVRFLNAELDIAWRDPLETLVTRVICSQKLARNIAPGKRVSLDAVCDRYGVRRDHRVRHGALLDAQLLAEVYLAMTRGQIDMFGFETIKTEEAPMVVLAPLIVLKPSAEELLLHTQYLESINAGAW